MGKVLMQVEGMDGHVVLLPDRVVIYRKGFWNFLIFGSNATREIPLAALAEVVFQEPSLLKRFGSIEFVRAGVMSERNRKKANHYAVKFSKAKLQEFESFKEKVFELINQMQQQQRK